jgi:hypothetical protein
MELNGINMVRAGGGVVDGDTLSVGSKYANNQVYSTSHPFYKAFSSRVMERMSEIAQREAVRKSSARKALLTISLESEELGRLTGMYPEFNILNYGMNRPGHAYWVASRRMANEWLAMQVNQQTSRFVHLGGNLLSHLIAGNKDVHLEIDTRNVVAMHDRHSASVDVLRVFGDYVQAGKDLGTDMPRLEYEKYLRGDAYKFCMGGDKCGHKADGLCVDGSVNCMPPLQVATAMVQMSASVAYGFIIYHPVMMVTDSGLIPGTGIHFERTDTEILFKYPEGVAGVPSYPLDVWAAWLTSHYFKVGPPTSKKNFQLELLKVRDAFLFYRMTKVDFIPEDTEVVHAMEMRSTQDTYAVYSWKLKDLASDATKASSWEPDNFVAAKRVVDRTYQNCMQLPAASFNQFAVRKQLKITNDRVVLEGTSVSVNPSLTPQQIDSLAVAIFAKCFVDRFDSGKLSQLMMTNLKDFAKFTEFGYTERVVAIALYAMWAAWDWSFGIINELVRNMCDAVRRFLGNSLVSRPIHFVMAPTYVKFSSVTSTWKKSVVGQLSNGVVAHVVKAKVNSKIIGGLLAETTQSVMSRLSAYGMGVDMRLLTTVVQRYSSGTGKRIPVMRVRVDNLETSMASALQERPEDEVRASVMNTLRTLNEFDEEPHGRHDLLVETVVREVDPNLTSREDYEHDPDPIQTLNEVYQEAIPGVALQNLEFDTASISLDPQDRTLAAPYLKLPKYFGDAPSSRSYYVSNVKALNVPKRQGTTQELLSAIAARNLSAPQIALPQDDSVIIPEIWQVFLDKACVSDAAEKLKGFAADPVALGTEAYADWMAKATPESLSTVKRNLEEHSMSLAEMSVGEYLVMLKADVKPTLSTKPLTSRTEPQVIVYHEKVLSSLYSALFRVLVNRFLSLLKPNYHVNLNKDLSDIRDFVSAIHPYELPMKYLENDFSKYDKSQGAFAFKLEEYIFRKLGMNEEMLAKWLKGHVDCSLRSVSTGLSLHVMYQRKSGDATTAFGNVILNVVSVTYAYASSNVVWAVFMGDDSLLCVSTVGVKDSSVQVLAEVFNLSAKSYVTDSPYFASTFFMIDNVNENIALIPDPIKRVEKLSMHVSALDPQWQDRYRSFNETMAPYRRRINTAALAKSVSERYTVSREQAARLPSALATLSESFKNYRSVWEKEPQTSNY